MNYTKGLSLLEILISLWILSLALIGLAKLQIHALQAVNSAYLTTVAHIRLESLNAIFQNQQQNFLNYFDHWQLENKQQLPAVQTELVDNNLKLSWFDPFNQEMQTLKMNLNK